MKAFAIEQLFKLNKKHGCGWLTNAPPAPPWTTDDGKRTYTVHVDNVGQVLSTNNKTTAMIEARTWVGRARKGEAGRADPHAFVMEEPTGELVAEYGEPTDGS